jgi:hypothetical protein
VGFSVRQRVVPGFAKTKQWLDISISPNIVIGDMPGAVCHYRLGASNELDDVSERVGGRVNIRRGSTAP